MNLFLDQSVSDSYYSVIEQTLSWRLSADNAWSVHYGEIRATRRAFTLGAKKSTFVDIFGIFDQFLTYITTNFP